jgi:LysM repeat protein
LNIPKEDIVKYNPSVATGLKKDQVLYFPVDAYVKRQAVVRPKEHKHTVKNGETLYGIAKRSTT